MLFTLVLLALLAGTSYAGQTCCEDLGCFTDDAPFNHLPLPECPWDIDMRLILYTRSTRRNGNSFTRNSIPIVYNPNKRTIFLIHGWLGNEYTSWLTDHKEALLEKDDVNVIIVGWDSIALWYPRSASNTRVVGAEVAYAIRRLQQSTGADPNNMYCIGHSLGAHTCGHVGKNIKIGRITGLDPAGPLFESYDERARLRTSDANLVDVIHTNSEAGIVLPLGIRMPIGHIDFYPNKGGPQPGCILDPFYIGKEDVEDVPELLGDITPACSHMRVLWLMEESIKSSDCSFISQRKCSNHDDLPGSCSTCSGLICQVMGYPAEQYSGRGIFYLTTAANEPYCR